MTNASLPEVPAGFVHPIVLGIDPGTQVVGYGAIVERPRGPVLLAAGTVVAPRNAPVVSRLGHIRRELDRLIARLRPDVVVVEEAFAAINIQSALRIGEARGVALSCAAISGIEIAQYTPARAKKALVGNGGADKSQVARMVAAELGLEEPPSPFDATDALALALVHVNERRLNARLSSARSMKKGIQA